MDRLCFGIAVYGQQMPEWWMQFALNMGTLQKYNIELAGMEVGRSMLTDSNRNRIVSRFLKGTADWLFWVDADNVIPVGGIRRLLDTGFEVVSGLYYQKSPPYIPVAYRKLPNGRYKSIENWNRGELLPIDAAGMGCCLVHRCVFEKIEKEFIPYQRTTGGITLVHKNDFKGKLPPLTYNGAKPFVKNGNLIEPLHTPDFEIEAFPHFILEYGRTEDMIFYENAIRAGFVPHVDTSVEVGHVGNITINGKDYRETLKKNIETTPRVTEYVNVEMMEADDESM